MPEPEKKPLATPGGTIAEVAAIILILSLIVFALGGLFVGLGGAGAWWERVLSFLRGLVPVLIFLSLFISFLALSMFGYFFHKLSVIRSGEHAIVHAAKAQDIQSAHSVKNDRWQRIVDHAESEHPNDWRIAILEADTVLDEMLDRMGYRGGSVGEKLKQVEPSDFQTLNSAWEAHKVRNRIAHDSEHPLSQREVKRVIALYKAVFEEFYFI